MSAEEVLTRFSALLRVGDAVAAAHLFADDATYDEPPRFAFRGRAAIQKFFSDFTASHRNAQFTIARTITQGDLLAAEWRWDYDRADDGTHRTFEGISMIQVKDGYIQNWRGYSALVTDRT